MPERTYTVSIDSRNRLSGTPTSFTTDLKPGLTDVFRVDLVYSDLPVPTGAQEGLFSVDIDEIGYQARSAEKNSASSTFVVPTTAGGGYRSITTETGIFKQSVQIEPPRNLSHLRVNISFRSGATPLVVPDECSFILRVWTRGVDA